MSGSTLADTALAVVFAVFIWWFSTGVVLLLNGMRRSAHRWSLAISSVLAAAALLALVRSAQQTSLASVYCAFTCALLVWGWHELSFLSGWITGPRTTALAPGTRGWARFVQALRAILWHELAIAAMGVAIIALTWGAPNQTGTLTFAVLWIMRTSAKLNLFLGVRNLSEEFLPPHLSYLLSYFRRRRLNGLFPFSVVAASGVLVAMVLQARGAGSAAHEVLGLSLAGTMLALAIVEHWMLVMPVSTSALWRWAMSRRSKAPTDNAAGSTPSSTPAAVLPDPIQESHEQLLHAR